MWQLDASSRRKAHANQVPPIQTHWLRLPVAVLFTLQFVILEIFVRDSAFYARQPRFIGGLVASLALMSLVLRSALLGRRWVRISVAALVSGVVVMQLAYYRYYHAPLDAQAALAARHAWADVLPVLERGSSELGLALFATFSLEYLLVTHGATVGKPLGQLSRLAAGVIGLLIAGKVRGTTSEFRAAHAVFALCTTRDPKASDGRLPLPELESTRPDLPNVLFIITESVRASDACLGPACATSPELDRLLPKRTNFENARAVSSYTAVALSALATGQLQLGPRAALSGAPDFFDLANAVRAAGRRYSLAYWSSQLAGVFERGPIQQVTQEVITAETLLRGAAADIEDSVAAVLDRRIADACEQRLAKLQLPLFVVLHLSGTHAPYAFDDARAPLKPWQRHVTWSGLPALHRAYLNSIIEQDQSIGRCLQAFLTRTRNEPWVVVYTSDHGEAFGEHSAIHHGQNLYDEQIRVPLLLSQGSGALAAEQLRQLDENRTQSVTHLDVLPTLLDVLGLSHHVALRAWAERLPGRSLVRRLGKLGAVPITNCTELLPCPINTWGVLGEQHKLTAQSWDGQWRCLSLLGVEHEIELGACTELRQVACSRYRSMPNSQPDPFCSGTH